MIIAGKVRRISLEKLGDWNESEFVVTLQVANTELSFPVTREEVGNYRVDDFLAFDLRAIRLKEINKSKPEDAKFSQSLYDRQSRVQEFERQAGIQNVINNNPEYVDENYDDDNYDDYDDHDEDETTEEPEETTSSQQNTVAIPRNTNQFNEQNSISQDDTETVEDIMNNDDEMSDEEIAARVGKRDESEIDTDPIVPPRVDTMDLGTITEADYQKASQNQQNNTDETNKEDTQEQNNEKEPDNQLETDDEEGEPIDDLDEDETDDEGMNVATGGLFNGDQDYGDQSDDEDE